MPGTQAELGFQLSSCLSVCSPFLDTWSRDHQLEPHFSHERSWVSHGPAKVWKLLPGPWDTRLEVKSLPKFCDHTCMPRFANLLEDSNEEW